MKNNIRTKELKEGEIIPLNFDFVFTSIFTNPDNMIIIENFVSCLLDLDLKLVKGNIKILNRNLSVENKKERNKQVDLLLEYRGEKINIEINNYYSKGITDRNIVYASYIHGKQLDYEDNTYSNKNKTIQINLNNIRTNSTLRERYFFRNDKNTILSEKFEIDQIDMVLARDICYNDYSNKLARWCMVLTSKTKEEFKKYLGEDLMEKEAKEKLEEKTSKMSDDEEVYALYSAYTKEELEKNTLIEEAEQRGHEKGTQEGIEQGIKNRSIEIAKNMIKENIDIDIISKITGLSKEEIEKLK